VEREEGAGPPSIADLAREYAAWEGVPSDTVYAAVSTPSSEAQEEVGSDRWLGETFREATHAPAVGLTTPLQAGEHNVVLLYHRERRLAVDFGTDGGEAHLASGGSSFTSVLLSTRVSNGTMVTTVGAALRSAKMLVLGGNAGLVLSAPHGGRVAPDRVAGRRAPRPRRRQLCRDDQRFVVARDSGTLELALFMRARLRSVSPTTGALSTPHLVVVSLHRRHIDANRPPCLMGPSPETLLSVPASGQSLDGRAEAEAAERGEPIPAVDEGHQASSESGDDDDSTGDADETLSSTATNIRSRSSGRTRKRHCDCAWSSAAAQRTYSEFHRALEVATVTGVAGGRGVLVVDVHGQKGLPYTLLSAGATHRQVFGNPAAAAGEGGQSRPLSTVLADTSSLACLARRTDDVARPALLFGSTSLGSFLLDAGVTATPPLRFPDFVLVLQGDKATTGAPSAADVAVAAAAWAGLSPGLVRVDVDEAAPGVREGTYQVCGWCDVAGATGKLLSVAVGAEVAVRRAGKPETMTVTAARAPRCYSGGFVTRRLGGGRLTPGVDAVQLETSTAHRQTVEAARASAAPFALAVGRFFTHHYA
jgi:hypothetical protein